jgi:D-alanyl-D-alanine carboxypeptidase
MTSDAFVRTPRRRAIWALSTCIAALLGLTGAAVVPGSAAGSGPAVVAPASSSALRKAADAVVEAGAIGQLSRVDDGRRVTRATSGRADRATDRPLRDNDRFEIGSNTKTMIATVALQLVAEGRLHLDDSVRKLLPGTVPASSGGDAITLRMLLQHTSGLYSYTDPAFMTAVIAHPRANYRPEQLVAAALEHPLTFAPGTGWAYSDTDYIVVGMILRRVTGRTPADLIRDRIARPLGLRHTYLVTGAESNTGPGYAHGYMATFTGPSTRPTIHYTDVSSWALGRFAGTAGAVVSTAPDLSRFLSALLSGRLLPPAQLAEMKTTVSAGAGTGLDYGLGIMRTDTPCGEVWGHTGSTFGHDSYMFGSADGRRTLVIDTTTDTELNAQSPEPNPVKEAMAAAEGTASLTAACEMFDEPVPTS